MNSFKNYGGSLIAFLSVSLGVCGFALPALAGDGDCVVFDPMGSHAVSNPILRGAVEMAGTLAYVSTDSGSVRIFDLIDPEQPTLIDTFHIGLNSYPFIWDIDVRNGIAFVSITSFTDAAGLYIVDTTDPTTSVLLGSNISVELGNITVAGDYLYGVNGIYPPAVRELYVFDISDLSAPALVSRTPVPHQGHEVSNLEVVGDRLYLTQQSEGLVIFDASDPTAPVVIGSFDSAVNAHDVKIDGSIAYLSDGDDGLKVIDIQDPSNPTLLASYPSFVNLESLVLDGSTLYGHVEDLGVRVLDVSDPLMIESLGLYLPSADRILMEMTAQGDQLLTMSRPVVPGQSAVRIEVIAMTNTCDHSCPLDADCPADLADDGQINGFDVSFFLGFFGSHDPRADFECDGQFNFFDVVAFLSAFSAGCP